MFVVASVMSRENPWLLRRCFRCALESWWLPTSEGDERSSTYNFGTTPAERPIRCRGVISALQRGRSGGVPNNKTRSVHEETRRESNRHHHPDSVLRARHHHVYRVRVSLKVSDHGRNVFSLWNHVVCRIYVIYNLFTLMLACFIRRVASCSTS